MKEEWEITEINAFALMRVRPDLVRDVIFDRVEIKRELDRGLTLAGVKARKVVKSTTRNVKETIIDLKP
ncbi:MAG: hypothetical protein EBY09_12525 [Verrucomicrobia bacterium]|nr:hypothetical protein [Verrucomicrobiota bacterium]